MTISFIIEHMEENEKDETFPPWVQLEYSHMRALAGSGTTVHFTNVSLTAAFSLGTLLEPAQDFLAEAYAHAAGVVDLMQIQGMPLEQICLLDPKATEPLAPSDGERFKWFLFGGILGDDPPRDRTSELRAHGFPSRHLGSVQMTTDTAVGVTKLVVIDKIPLEKITYLDFPTIRFNAQESVEMPFRYIEKQGEPLLPPGMRDLLYEDLSKGFDGELGELVDIGG